MRKNSLAFFFLKKIFYKNCIRPPITQICRQFFTLLSTYFRNGAFSSLGSLLIFWGVSDTSVSEHSRIASGQIGHTSSSIGHCSKENFACHSCVWEQSSWRAPSYSDLAIVFAVLTLPGILFLLNRFLNFYFYSLCLCSEYFQGCSFFLVTLWTVFPWCKLLSDLIAVVTSNFLITHFGYAPQEQSINK